MTRFVVLFGTEQIWKVTGVFSSREEAELFRKQDAYGYCASVHVVEEPVLNSEPPNWREHT